jgi:hypothetical protein
MFLSYNGSLLYHLAAQMPFHCTIIVAPPSCPFVPLACCCLLCCLFCLHLPCASLFWLIVVFTPLSCLLLPPSPKKAFVTVHPIANASCPPPYSSFLPSCPFVVPAGCCITCCLCCWSLCRCCAHANALVALALLPLLCWHLCHCFRRHCHHLSPLSKNLCCASLFWLIVVFTAHCRGGVADDKKCRGAAEDDGVYH